MLRFKLIYRLSLYEKDIFKIIRSFLEYKNRVLENKNYRLTSGLDTVVSLVGKDRQIGYGLTYGWGWRPLRRRFHRTFARFHWRLLHGVIRAPCSLERHLWADPSCRGWRIPASPKTAPPGRQVDQTLHIYSSKLELQTYRRYKAYIRYLGDGFTELWHSRWGRFSIDI